MFSTSLSSFERQIKTSTRYENLLKIGFASVVLLIACLAIAVAYRFFHPCSSKSSSSSSSSTSSRRSRPRPFGGQTGGFTKLVDDEEEEEEEEDDEEIEMGQI